MLAHEEGVLYTLFQVNKVVQSRSVTPEPTLGIREQVSGCKDPHESAVYYALHGLTLIGLLTVFERVILAGF
jgi:hypothetical protein